MLPSTSRNPPQIEREQTCLSLIKPDTQTLFQKVHTLILSQQLPPLLDSESAQENCSNWSGKNLLVLPLAEANASSPELALSYLALRTSQVASKIDFIYCRFVVSGAHSRLFHDTLYFEDSEDFTAKQSWHRLQLFNTYLGKRTRKAHAFHTSLHRRLPHIIADPGMLVGKCKADQCAQHALCQIQADLAAHHLARIVPFEPLGDWLEYRRYRTSSLEQRQAWARQIRTLCTMLTVQQIFHRDLKAENLLVTAELSLRLTDFEYAESDDPSQVQNNCRPLSTDMVGTTVTYYEPLALKLGQLTLLDRRLVKIHHAAADSLACLWMILSCFFDTEWNNRHIPLSQTSKMPLFVPKTTRKLIIEELQAKQVADDIVEFVQQLLPFCDCG